MYVRRGGVKKNMYVRRGGSEIFPVMTPRTLLNGIALNENEVQYGLKSQKINLNTIHVLALR